MSVSPAKLTHRQTSRISTSPAYYRTPHWQVLRIRKFRESGGWCDISGCRQRASEIHHKTYIRCPWYEYLDDLIACCHYHHRQLEQIRRQEVAAQRRGRRCVPTDSCVTPQRFSSLSQLNLPLRR